VIGTAIVLPIQLTASQAAATKPKEGIVKSHLHLILAFCAALAPFVPASIIGAPTGSPRLVLTADSGWKFALGDPSGAEAPSFSDQSWRTI
jgi:beta-galactosidase